MATVADLNGVKTAIQSILTTANTIGASPIDLSNGLANSQRVKQVLKVNTEMIRPQASIFPLVTCYIVEKDPVGDQIAGSQLNAKRRAKIVVNIVGSVWNNNFTSISQDPADEDICTLMENIELILRSDATLQGKVNWQKPGKVKYYATPLNEQVHLRSGILPLECEIFY